MCSLVLTGKVPGDDCPLVWGQCSHCFHMHCILKWLNSQQVQQQCPMCRQEWKFKEWARLSGNSTTPGFHCQLCIYAFKKIFLDYFYCNNECLFFFIQGRHFLRRLNKWTLRSILLFVYCTVVYFTSYKCRILWLNIPQNENIFKNTWYGFVQRSWYHW